MDFPGESQLSHDGARQPTGQLLLVESLQLCLPEQCYYDGVEVGVGGLGWVGGGGVCVFCICFVDFIVFVLCASG